MMIAKRDFKYHFLLLVLFYLADPVLDVFAETEASSQQNEVQTSIHSDRFIFRGGDIDDLVMIFFTFERGKDAQRFYGEFMGAIFERNHWAFLEGNDKYVYQAKDLKIIQPSYYAGVQGSNDSGFILQYDGGDYTLKISSGPVYDLYTPLNGESLKKAIGISEAVITLHGKEHWGDLIHESLVWNGFNGLNRYKHLYKDYLSFYLKSEKGMQIFFHKNKADQGAFKKESHLPETLKSEEGAIFYDNKIIHSFEPPIRIVSIKEKTSLFSFYSVPHRWRVETSPELGRLFIWSRGEASISWMVGGYYIMAIEGIVKDSEGSAIEERIWGFAEYFP